MVYHPTTITDPHRDWLDERNRLMVQANSNDPRMTDAHTDVLSGQMIAIESRLRDTPACTTDGIAAKLLMLIQLTAEGNEIGEEVAAVVVREAQDILDMGSLVSVARDVRIAIGEGVI